RIRTALRRVESKSSGGSPKSFTLCGRLKVFPLQLRAVDEETGKEINLSPREISILRLLFQNRGDAVHRDKILDECWGLTYYPGSRTLDQHIVNLRKKIEPDPAHPTFIETVRGIGYRVGDQDR
ncbi:MAG: helix-turn-helix domain-containing protein, partial [Verrucomicrobiales bacterium]|nr:helix-turn-helix domain-containing protein [Verrucomicrobiales bacterium]